MNFIEHLKSPKIGFDVAPFDVKLFKEQIVFSITLLLYLDFVNYHL